ncbi:IS110 family transposase, partial [Brucella cytisi]
TDKIDATVLAHLLRADLVPEAWAPSEKSRELRVALRERMFYVRLRTMTKNRIVTVFDRYPEQTAQLKKLGDLFGKADRIQLAEVNVSDIDRVQIDRGLAFIGDINERIKQSETTIRAMTKANANVKLLKTIPGIGEFFARLIDAEIDDVSRFRNAKKFAAYAGLVPSTYSSGGKTYHGNITKQGNKWLRWAFVEAVAPAIARKLLTIAFQILRDQRAYEPRGITTTEGASTISRLS